jgi:DNA modification methylase
MTAEADDSRITSDKAILSSDLLPGHFVKIINGDCRTALKELAPESIQCVVTSPPYFGLRDYGHADQIGQEETPDAYVQTMRQVFAEVWRVLKDDGILWLNLGDSYANTNRGHNSNGFGNLNGSNLKNKTGYAQNRNTPIPAGLKEKDLCGIPWTVAMALRADGWYLRQDIIWHKPNPMPESVTDRCTKSHEYIFLLTKSPRYYYDAEAIREPVAPSQIGRVREDVIGGNKGELIHHSPGAVYKKGRTGKTAMRGQGHFRNGGGPTNREGRDMSDVDANAGDDRNKRDVWTVTTLPYKDAHFATFPPDLIKPCILAGTKPGDVVLDPFGGSGTTGMVALELGRRAVLVELNPEYTKLCDERCTTTRGLPLAG